MFALPPLPLRYLDYAAWQRGRVEGGAHAAELAFWEQELAGAPFVVELPSDRPRPIKQTFAGDTVRLEVATERGRENRVHLVGSGCRLNKDGTVGRLTAPHVPLRTSQVNDSLLALLTDCYLQVVDSMPREVVLQ